MTHAPTPAEVLRRHGLRPKKGWGQNFLGDPRILGQLAALTGAGPGDWVVELGAGLGHFTRSLAARGARVVAVERDRELVPLLREVVGSLGVEVAEADAKSLDLHAIAGRAKKPLIVCGNLPYHLSSPILFHLLDQRAALRRAILLLQREVAERIVAPPGSRSYGLLSVLVQHVAEASIGLTVAPGAFTPPPEVTSSALTLDFYAEPRPPVRDEQRFRALVKAAFALRRKTLWNALKSIPGARAALETAQIDPQRRAETLSVADFAALERALRCNS